MKGHNTARKKQEGPQALTKVVADQGQGSQNRG